MTGKTTTRYPEPATQRAPAASRRLGYLVAATINIVGWYGINVWPGWAIVPFLTPDFERVLGAVNTAILASIAVNLVYLVYDRRWLRAVGDLIAAAVALLALLELWQVFPFAFESALWPPVARTVMAFGIGGCGISIIVQLVVLARTALGPRRNDHS